MGEVFVERKDYNKVISVKLVIPCGCNAKCPFCYNRDKPTTQYDTHKFLNNFIPSLSDLLNKINNKNPVSLDITGGEPTLDVDSFSLVLMKLRDFHIKDKVQRVTLTTNGTNLYQMPLNLMKDTIDYVNISVHDYRKEYRRNIMGIEISELSYKRDIKRLNSVGIAVSATAVIYHTINNFDKWRDEFINWAQRQGFISVRFRCDVFWKHSHWFDAYMVKTKNEEQFQIITDEWTMDSHWCRLRRKDKMRVFFLHGVADTSILTKGIEYVIHDDGECYCDFYKNVPLNKYEYDVGKIYDKQ